MRDKIYAYLKLQKEGAPGKELVEQVLKMKGVPVSICDKLIQTAVADDPRFIIDDRRCWRIIERKGVPFSEAELVFLSLLTVDVAHKTRIITEVSARKLRDNKTVDRFHTLINPGSSILSNLNVSSDLAQEIKEGVPVENAALSLLHFMGSTVVVGYNIQLLIHQLNMVLSGVNESIENPSLCLRYLTKKLIPDIQVKSFDDIVGYFKIPTIDSRRTEDEVSAIIEVFGRVSDLLTKQDILTTLEDILEFQYPTIEYIDFGNYAFDRSFLWAIPQRPGIYKMKDKDGKIIYIGKAKNLRNRISSYFWNTADRLQKVTDLLKDLYLIEYEITGSELAAMLMEFRLIQQHRPKLNQQIEVHERAARYGNLRNFILILPSSTDEAFDLFFIKEGLPLQRCKILKSAVNFSEVEMILDEVYYDTISSPPQAKENKNLSGKEMGEGDIVLSWVELHKDQVNYIDVDIAGSKEICLKLLKDYIQDEETLRKHFRFT